MKTKLAIFSLFGLFLMSQVRAQTNLSFGVSAGVNFQNLTGKDNTGDKYANKLKTGFTIGANVEVPVATDFYLQPGILYAGKGAKYKNSDDKTTLSYLEIPVYFLYKPVLGNGKLLLGVGPYAAFGIGGKDRFGNIDTDVQFGSKPDEYKRFDAGGNFLVGYELSNRFSAQLNAGLGLVNLNNREDGDTKSSLKNTGFGVSVGYRFN